MRVEQHPLERLPHHGGGPDALDVLPAGPDHLLDGRFGLRVAYIASPPKFNKRLEQTIADMTYMPSPLTAEIARLLQESGTADSTMELKKAEANRRNRLAKKKLRRFQLQQQANGYFAWLKLPETWNASDFVREAAEHDVKVTNGEQFLVGASGQSNTVRLSLSAPECYEELQRGLDELASILRQR